MVLSKYHLCSTATFRKLLPLLVILSSILTIFVLLTSKTEEDLLRSSSIEDSVVKSPSPKNQVNDDIITFENIISTNRTFDPTNEDLFVLLHIQKTSGTVFERHLVHNLSPQLPCSCTSEKRKCSCPRQMKYKQLKSIADATWLISRFSTGWICGLHPDFTQLKECLSGLKRLYFLTFLRHPLHRFVSEFRHVQRGATWKASKSHCKQEDTHICYGTRSDWSNVSLEEFLDCPSNMAINRQAKMLASYNSSTMCSNKSEDNELLLATAMKNLHEISFFGLCEHQKESQVLFEKTFNLKFTEDFKQSEDNKTRVLISKLSDQLKDRILRMNSLDVKLYNYASSIFAERCNRLTRSNNCNIATDPTIERYLRIKIH